VGRPIWPRAHRNLEEGLLSMDTTALGSSDVSLALVLGLVGVVGVFACAMGLWGLYYKIGDVEKRLR